MKRHGIRNLVGMLAVSGALLFGGALAEAEAEPHEERSVLRANGQEAGTDNGSSSSTSGEGTEVYIDKDGKVYVEMKDEDGNGVPDEIDELRESNSTDRIFTITLTAAMNAVLNLMTFVYGFYRWKKMGKNVNETAEKSTQAVADYSGAAQKIAESVLRSSAQNEKLLAELDGQKQANAKLASEVSDLKESNAKLAEQYSMLAPRLDTILETQALVADTEANTRSGLNAKVQAKVKEAIAYGKQGTEAKA